jgi:hypothetical protein
MHYKTIVLGLLQERSTLHERLRESRTLIQAVDRCATHLKARHEFWLTRIVHTSTDHEQTQLSSSALEIAVQEFRDDLPPETTPDGPDSLSLDDAMDFLRRYTPSN